MPNLHVGTPEIEALRRAAASIRERIGKATAGPWNAAQDGLVWADRLGDPVCGSTEPEDAVYIGSWHPPVALAVADWLDHEATRLDNLMTQWEQQWAGDAIVVAALVSGVFRHPLAIARAYLREA